MKTHSMMVISDGPFGRLVRMQNAITRNIARLQLRLWKSAEERKLPRTARTQTRSKCAWVVRLFQNTAGLVRPLGRYWAKKKKTQKGIKGWENESEWDTEAREGQTFLSDFVSDTQTEYIERRSGLWSLTCRMTPFSNRLCFLAVITK